MSEVKQDYFPQARRRWPRALWIAGNGPWASVSRCHPGATVILCDTQEAAMERKAGIDRLGCGSGCHGSHTVISLAIEE